MDSCGVEPSRIPRFSRWPYPGLLALNDHFPSMPKGLTHDQCSKPPSLPWCSSSVNSPWWHPGMTQEKQSMGVDPHPWRYAASGCGCSSFLICKGNESQLNSLHKSIAWEKLRYFCKFNGELVHLRLWQWWITLLMGAIQRHIQL